MDAFWSFWVQPNPFLTIGALCFALIPLARFILSDRASYHLERLERSDNTRARRSRNRWGFLEQLAAIMGIVSFVIQAAVWIYPWL